ncbi:alpha-ketoglutarate-dependent dioxygenase AlkB [Sinirhodobacter ferrireducens]|uniref:Alpha-ketoglutarate-dependent dioxygenase AlkB n=1 Tax=Paenirhodobacter ferrireducens TaxID=1215032 RepID=A0A443LI49_9RHOB|nr:alpha-ketoglutarate-dependent dioxygenase AlkB [Sinirhodobacter ferrireducens]RWR48798.1 alpha-ketoglutarate-dependent dioxygenase AlkB [Sinirhodobacter ferrireducens]
MTESDKNAAERPQAQEIRGFLHYPGWLLPGEQRQMLADLRAVVAAAPLVTPVTPSGRPMSVRMSAAGRFGWVSDRRGYRYAETHPQGTPWPAIPDSILAVWRAVSGSARQPECCLINFYDAGARMGLHQDRDEADFGEPVVSISLGDDGLFRIGNESRGGATQSLWLRSGDVLVMGGPARLRHHGIDRIAPGTSMLLPKGGRLNLTLRVVT